MSQDLNSVNIIGRITKKPELKYLANGTAVCKFDIAVNDDYFSKEKNETIKNVSFFNVTVWGKSGENVTNYTDKGSQVAVAGKLQQQSWETPEGSKRSRIIIVASRVQFLSSSKKKEEVTDYDNIKEVDSGEVISNDYIGDDEIPF